MDGDAVPCNAVLTPGDARRYFDVLIKDFHNHEALLPYLPAPGSIISYSEMATYRWKSLQTLAGQEIASYRPHVQALNPSHTGKCGKALRRGHSWCYNCF